MSTAPKVTTAPTPAADAAAPAVAVSKPVAPKKVAVRAKAVKVAKPVAVKAKPPVVKAKPVAVAKPAKVKKPKLVRDSFTIPKAEYTVLEDLKLRAMALAQPAKKSELLRAGIKALAAMSDAALKAALQAVPTIKTGRPAAVAVTKPAAKKAVKKIVKKA
ncbi:hypothetical protein [Rhodoferax sp. WC2427]|uniref:hypothetical protein n=1 Tax=Rhodoferax sp. WC2427 TaxID=3234144 RepID=UPI003467A0F2